VAAKSQAVDRNSNFTEKSRMGMTRQEILENYDVRDGIIVSPGKYEREWIYAPHYHQLFLEGESEENSDGDIVFSVLDEDREDFPELGDKQDVLFRETDNGFWLEELV
jgi:hypothetical protein